MLSVPRMRNGYKTERVTVDAAAKENSQLGIETRDYCYNMRVHQKKKEA